MRRANAKGGWVAVQKQLAGKARDLGSPSRDPVFGWGLVQAGGCGSAAARR